MHRFLADLPAGREEGRYLPAALPSLPFADLTFDLGLCSHFLFLYSAHYSADFHLRSIDEMLRVAREVRIFPLLALDGRPSRHLDAVVEWLAPKNLRYQVQTVDYEFQRGGNQMLTISR